MIIGTISLADIILAFFGGILTFIRPCIFLIIFAFLAFALNIALSYSAKKKLSSILKAIIPLYAGISIIFILCAFPGEIQRFFMDPKTRPIITKIASVVILGFGLAFMSTLKRPGFISEKNANWLNGIGFFVLGLSLGVAWTHCLTPILGQILMPVSVNPKMAASTIILLIIYSVGLAIPFLITGLIVQKIVNTLKLDQNSGLKALSGSFLVFIGASLFSDSIWLAMTRVLVKISSDSLSNQLEVLLLQVLKN